MTEKKSRYYVDSHCRMNRVDDTLPRITPAANNPHQAVINEITFRVEFINHCLSLLNRKLDQQSSIGFLLRNDSEILEQVRRLIMSEKTLEKLLRLQKDPTANVINHWI